MLNSNINAQLKNSVNQLTGNICIQITDNDIYLNQFDNENNKKISFNNIPINNNFSINSAIFTFYNNLFLIDPINQKELFYKIEEDKNIYKSKFLKIENQYFNKSIKFKTSLWLSSTIRPDTFVIFYNPKINFTEFNFEVDDNFIKNIIKDSEIIYNTNKNFENFIKNLYVDEVTYSLNNDKLTLFGITTNGYYKSVEIDRPLNENNEPIIITDDLIFSLLKQYNLISTKALNFEFYFNTDYDTKNLIGLFFTKEELSDLQFNIDKINLENKLQINLLDLIDDEFKFNSINNLVKLPIKTLNYDKFPKKVIEYEYEYEYGFFDNLDNCTTEIQEITLDNTEYAVHIKSEYGEQLLDPLQRKYKVKKIKENYNNWIKDFGQNTNYKIKRDFYLDKYIYVINDKNENLFNIKNIDFSLKNIELIKPYIYFSNFIDLYKSNKKVGYRILNSYSDNNIKLTIKDVEPKNLFQNSDYIQIRIYNKIFRVISYKNYCCNKCDYGVFNSENYIIESCKFNMERYNNSILVNIAFDGFFDIEEGSKIKLTTEHFKNIPFEVIKFWFKNNTSYITIIDKNGTYFNKCKNILSILADYTKKSYFYSFFNPNGSINTVLKSIKSAFDRFNSGLFDVSVQNNDLIFKVDNENKAYIKINIANSRLPIDNILIDDIPLKPIKYKDDFDFFITSRNRTDEIEFFGGNNKSKNSRFAINREWGLENLIGNEVIFNNKHFSNLKTHYFNEQFKNYSNYLEEPIETQEDIYYKYIDNYIVLELENNEGIIQNSTSGLIEFFYKIFSKIYKLNLITLKTIDS